MEHQTDTTQTTNKPRQAKRLYALLATVVFVVLIAGVFKLTSSSSHQNSGVTTPVALVRITKGGFQPATLSVKQGTKVIWTNADNSLHQVAANPYPQGTSLPSLKSEILNNNQTYSYVANSTGTFGYHDQLTPTTNGTLVVQK